MKKILIFSLAYYPNAVSGAEGAIKEITDRINDIEFHMITLRFMREHPSEELFGNVHVHRVGLTVRTLEDPFYTSCGNDGDSA